MAGYYIVLALATAIMPEAPLTAFARAQPEQYVAYQVLLLLLFMGYLVLLICHVIVERSPMAGLQLMGAFVVYIHRSATHKRCFPTSLDTHRDIVPFWSAVRCAQDDAACDCE